MANNTRAKRWFCGAASAGLLAACAAMSYPANAQDKGQQISAPTMTKVDLRTAPEIPAVPRPAGLVTNRPTMPMADYVAAKNAAAARQAPGRAKPSAAPPPPAAGVTLFTQVAGASEVQTANGHQFPPDGDIATSAEWMVQVTNDQVVMYNWLTNAFKQVNLNTFFASLALGRSLFIFAPRVIHDKYWDRFVVVAAACDPCSGSSTDSRLVFGVSLTGDPSAQWVLETEIPFSAGDFIDFPQLGMDLDAIIVTFNHFVDGAFSESVLKTFDKAHLYNGLGLLGKSFGGGKCTMAPPYVLDRRGTAYVLQFCPGDTKVIIGSLTNSSRDNAQFTHTDNTVNVVDNGLPPDASQPGTSYTLDTGDNRFENRSLQVGTRIINTATINLAGFPAPAFYTFNIGATPHTLVAENPWFTSLTSNDWHPSIVANLVDRPTGSVLGEVFVTWMSTDPANNRKLQLRAGGGLGDNPQLGAGVAVFTSPLSLTNQTDAAGIHRSGDYTSITTYPDAALGCQADEVGILTGEVTANNSALWSTRIGIVKHC